MFRSLLRLTPSISASHFSGNARQISSIKTGSMVSLASKLSTPLETLNMDDLCALLDHCHLSDLKPFIQKHDLTG